MIPVRNFIMTWPLLILVVAGAGIALTLESVGAESSRDLRIDIPRTACRATALTAGTTTLTLELACLNGRKATTTEPTVIKGYMRDTSASFSCKLYESKRAECANPGLPL